MALGTTIFGRARVIVEADGSLIPAQVERIGEKAGGDAGNSFAKSFDKSAGSGLKKSLENFRQSFRKWDKSLGDGNSNMSALTRRTRAFFRTLGNTEPMIRFRLGLADLGEKFKSLGSNIDVASGKMEKHIPLWQRLSHNTRQWTLIIGAVIAGMEGLAVLSSALGPALLVLAGGLGALVTGAYGLGAVFVNLFQDIAKAPAAMKPMIREFLRLREFMADFNDQIALAAFAEMGGAFDQIRKTLAALLPTFRKVGSAVGKMIKAFSEGTKPGTDAFKEINRFIENSADLLGDIAKVAGSFFTSLIRGINRANPLTEKFVDYLGVLADRFDAFTRSDGFDEWLSNAESVFGALGRLLDDTFRTLNNLVTPESTGRLVEFIDNIARFISGPGEDLLKFFGELDIFGVLSKALADFGEALDPLAEPMQDLAGAFGDIMKLGIDALAPMITAVADALAPFVQHIADFMAENPQLVANGIAALAAAFVILKGAQGIGGLAGKVGGFVTAMNNAEKKIPGWKSSFKGLGAGLIASIFTITSEDQVTIDTFGMNIALALALSFGGGPFAMLVAALTAFVATAIKDAVDGGSYALDQWAFKPGDVFYDLVEGWGNMLTNWRDVELPNWWAGVVTWFKGLSLPGKGYNPWADTAAEWGLELRKFFTITLPMWWNGIVTWFKGLSLPGAGYNPWADTAAAWGLTLRKFFTVTLPAWWLGIVNWFKGLSLIGKGTNPLADLAASWGQALRTFVTVTLPAWWASVVAFFSGKSLSGLLGGVKASSGSGGGGGLANGGMVYGPRRFLVGEAGPEAVVPLNRSLSQVDPSVRWLSALAQGKAPGLAGGGVVGGGRSVSIAAGAIQVTGGPDPRRTAQEVVNRIVERVVG